MQKFQNEIRRAKQVFAELEIQYDDQYQLFNYVQSNLENNHDVDENNYINIHKQQINKIVDSSPISLQYLYSTDEKSN